MGCNDSSHKAALSCLDFYQIDGKSAEPRREKQFNGSPRRPLFHQSHSQAVMECFLRHNKLIRRAVKTAANNVPPPKEQASAIVHDSDETSNEGRYGFPSTVA